MIDDTEGTGVREAIVPRTGIAAGSCGTSELLQLLGLADDRAPALRDVRFMRRRLSAGQALHRQGDRCTSLYVLRFGTIKTGVVDEAGNEQVLGFRMRGDLLGSDGLAEGSHSSYAIALEDSDVVVIDLAALAARGAPGAALERELYRLTSRETALQSAAMLTMGTLSAEARVARLIASIAQRYGELGYSRSRFNLRMSRLEIANHLGLTLETVSRAFSALAASGAIEVSNRAVVIRDLDALRGGSRPRARGPARSGTARTSTARAAVPTERMASSSAAL